jgi:hypothetical protein
MEDRFLSYLFAVLPFYHELMLKHDQVSLSRLKTAESLELGRQRIQKCSLDWRRIIREKTYPAETLEHGGSLFLIGEVAQLIHPG